MSDTDIPQDTHYLEIFKEQAIRSARRILAQIQQAEGPLPANHQVQTMLTLHYAFKFHDAWPDIRTLLLTVSPKMAQAGYRDEWIPYLEQGIGLGHKLNDLAATAELQLQLGLLYQLRGKYALARTHLEASVDNFEYLNTSFGQIRALNRLAYLARLQRQFEEAQNLVKTVFRLSTEEDAERAYSYYVLALVALDKRDWLEAVRCSKESFDLWQLENNQRMMGRTLISRGFALHRLEEYEAAIDTYQQALTLFEQIQDQYYQALVKMNLGNIYISLEQPTEALSIYSSVERVFRRVQDQPHLAMIHHNKGMAYSQLEQWDKARMAYLLGIKKKQEFGNVASLVNSMGELGVTYLAQNKVTDAVAVFEEALDLLKHIQDEPGYEYLFETITTYLQQALDRL